MYIPAKEAVKLIALPYAKVEVFDGKRWWAATSIEEAIVAQSDDEDVEKSYVARVANTATPFTLHETTRLKISFRIAPADSQVNKTT
jgi:hypothetical protein